MSTTSKWGLELTLLSAQSGGWVSQPGCPQGLTHFLEPSPLFSLDHFLSYQAGVLLQVYPQSPRISLCLVAKLAQTQLSTPFRRGSLTCDPQPLLPFHPQTASPGLCPLAAHYLSPHSSFPIFARPFFPHLLLTTFFIEDGI